MADEKIKKRLVFYFYAFENYKDNYANKLHLNCLKHYANIFDEVIFVISVDDLENKELILDVELEIIKCGFKDIRFKLHKNNAYREVPTFYDEIVERLDKLDGITFFGHNKGTTNVQKADAVIKSIEAWILGMYYLNLEFISEVEEQLCSDVPRFYGAFLLDARKWDILNVCYYVGTFYWVNGPKIAVDILTKYVEPLDTYHHRGFAECFPGLLYRNCGLEIFGSHEHRFYTEGRMDSYYQMQTYIPFLLGNDLTGYNKFCEKNLENV